MNELLQLKGTFEQASNNNQPGPINLPKGQSVSASQLEKLKNDLVRLKELWAKNNLLPGALVSVFYNKVAAKSNRISGLLAKGKITANSSIVGARFRNTKSPKHVITHYVKRELLDISISHLEACITILNKNFSGIITHDLINRINEKDKSKALILDYLTTNKTSFLKVIRDAYYLEKFDLDVDSSSLTNQSIVTIYKTDVDTIELFRKMDIDIPNARILDDNITVLLLPKELALLKQTAPYLIAMGVSDLSKMSKTEFDLAADNRLSIPSPINEPIIGVIDTMFDEQVYFAEWVSFTNMLSEDIPLENVDYEHGTAVASIIVDGPAFNPSLDDGCGRFRARHFGVAKASQFSSFTVLKCIENIIKTNPNIKVWNLSLGSTLEINPNFISPEASLLDRIQFDNDVIFVVAGTNKSREEKEDKRIGAPADSINSLVVNSVTFENNPAAYGRQGPVLSFFTKPDISYYGGDDNKAIRVCTPMGESFVRGTSFAAPWIARKLSYLIDVLGLSREVAKALIINASTGWKHQEETSVKVGHGIVPVKISDIVSCPDNEIQFVLSGTSQKYNTYNYNIPVPINNDKQPFIAKITLCYFPYCSRDQGVDYTNTELDVSFGRLKDGKIKPIDNNYQTSDDEYFIWEEDARRLFRKWDNVKHIREVYKDKTRAKTAYDRGLWGISLKTKERLEQKYGENIRFGIVVTLREINGVNRINEFIQHCQFRGWLVNRVTIENRLDIYNIAEETVEWDEL